MERQRAVMVGGGREAAGSAPPPVVIDWYAFAGTPDDVSRRLFGLPPSILAHPFYALLLQGGGKADVHVFERATPGDREGPVHVWQGPSLGSLPGDLVAILSAKNTTAVLAGALRQVLRAYGDAAHLGVVPCPPSPRGAFGHPLKRYAEDPVLQAFVVGL